MNNSGNTKHGGHSTLTYSRWKSMRQRCTDPSHKSYTQYGGAGITVCDRWQDFAHSLSDMGECPPSMTLDRIENSIGYQPGNCRWASKADQNKNRSNIVMLTYQGETKSVTEWATQFGMRQANLTMRLRLGWSIERALTQPLKARTVRSIR